MLEERRYKMVKEYKHNYYVTDNAGIPLQQPDNGYTLQQAVNRVNREVRECHRLGLKSITDLDYCIYDKSTHPWTRVL